MATPPMPLKGSNFGRKFADGTVHQGIDIAPSGSDAVVSPVKGVVVDSGRSTDPTSAGSNGFGPAWVTIDSFSDGTRHTLAHLDATERPLPKKGDEVDEGEQVGLIARGVVPSKFHSGVPHLHWEIVRQSGGAKLDPVSWLAMKGIPTSIAPLPGSSSTPWWVWLVVGYAIVKATDRRR